MSMSNSEHLLVTKPDLHHSCILKGLWLAPHTLSIARYHVLPQAAGTCGPAKANSGDAAMHSHRGSTVQNSCSAVERVIQQSQQQSQSRLSYQAIDLPGTADESHRNIIEHRT